MGDDETIKQAFENLPDNSQMMGMRYALHMSFCREYSLEIRGKSRAEYEKMYDVWLKRMTIK